MWSIAVAASLVLASILAVFLNPTDTQPQREAAVPVERVVLGDVTDLEARQIVLVALKEAADATDLDLTQRYRAVEVASPNRVVERTIRTIIIGDDFSEERSSHDDFAQKKSEGLETRFVDDTWYFEYAGDTFKQSWMYDVRLHGTPGSMGLGSVDQARTFRPDVIAKQLELEGLATVRRTSDSGIALEVTRTAAELAPVRSTAGLDPIGSSTARLAASAPNTPVTVRIEVTPGRELRKVIVNFVGPVPHRAGPRQITKVLSRVTNEVELRPTDERRIQKPEPSDVMVVGDPIATRLGADDLAGPHGTLNELNDTDLAKLLEKLRQDMQATSKMNPIPTPTVEERAERTAALKRIIAAYREYEPIDRRRFVDDPACTPFWPASRRRMDDATVRANPRRASWRCTLLDGPSSFTLRPRDRFGQIDARIGKTFIGFRSDHADQMLRDAPPY